ncbi:MAG: hypothetical protein AB7T14_03285 [Candidatus Methylacidiphilaceae bacterium]
MPSAKECSGAEPRGVRKNPGASSSPGAGAFWWAALLLVLPAVGVSLVTRSLGRAEVEASHRELAERVVRLEALRKADREALESYRWIDRGKGVIAIPIERAMELEEERLKSKPVGPSPVLLPGALMRQQPAPKP